MIFIHNRKICLLHLFNWFLFQRSWVTLQKRDLWLRSLLWSRSARLKISVTENERVVELQKLSISLLYLLMWSWKAKKTHSSQQQQKFLGLLKFFLGSKIITAFLSTPWFTLEFMLFDDMHLFGCEKWLEVNRNQINVAQFIIITAGSIKPIIVVKVLKYFTLYSLLDWVIMKLEEGRTAEKNCTPFFTPMQKGFSLSEWAAVNLSASDNRFSSVTSCLLEQFNFFPERKV